MDAKLPSVDGQGVDEATQWDFMNAAASRHLFVKIVIGPSTDRDELQRALRNVDSISPEIEVFLQPVTPFAGVTSAPTPSQVLDLQDMALGMHRRVRVVPQTHKMIGQL